VWCTDGIRDLGAAIVIDAATRRGAAVRAADCVLHTGVTIRGRAQAEDVYVLPLAGGAGTELRAHRPRKVDEPLARSRRRGAFEIARRHSSERFSSGVARSPTPHRLPPAAPQSGALRRTGRWVRRT